MGLVEREAKALTPPSPSGRTGHGGPGTWLVAVSGQNVALVAGLGMACQAEA